jgi:chromosome partitioning protein
MSSSTLAIWTAKGGTGKTVTAVNLAALLGRRGRVLLVDLDAQASASVAVGVAPANGLLDALRGEVPLAELVEPTFDWLDVVPGGPELANAERSLVRTDTRSVAQTHPSATTISTIIPTNTRSYAASCRPLRVSI